jgi:molecular chaperone DnaK (HSP70)
MFVAKEKDGPYVNDECFKMALTDAISVACKALGVGADVYWQEDRTKYDGREEGKKGETRPAKSGDKISEAQIKRMFAIAKGDKDIIQRVLDKCGYEKEADVYKSDYNDVCALIEAELQGETKVEMATWEQIDEISKLAKGKYGDNKEEYKAALKTLHEMGKISTPFPIDRNKNIKWTVEDYKAVKEDLETPF